MEKFNVSDFVKNLETRDKDTEMLPNPARVDTQYQTGGYIDSSAVMGRLVNISNEVLAVNSGPSLINYTREADFLFSCFSPGDIVSERVVVKYKNEQEMKNHTSPLRLGYELCYSGREGDTDNYYAIYHKGESMSTYSLIKNGETAEKED